jgi:hypothetical protein
VYSTGKVPLEGFYTAVVRGYDVSRAFRDVRGVNGQPSSNIEYRKEDSKSCMNISQDGC